MLASQMTGQARHIGSFANYCTEQFMFMIMQKYFRGFFSSRISLGLMLQVSFILKL